MADRQSDEERAALAQGAFGPNSAFVLLDNVATNG